jgi:O-antigen/teichoic acid export membrane protein
MSIRKHTAYNVVGSVLPMGLSLFTIPIYIGLVGEARYGVLALAWMLLGYFGLFDLGLGRATAQRIAALGKEAPEKIAATFWTALTMNLGLGLVGGALIWPVTAYFFGYVFNVNDALRPELSAAVPWLILAVPMATLSGVFSGSLEGLGKFFELNIISVASSVLIQLLPLSVALIHGPDLAWLLPSVIAARLVSLIALFVRCSVHVLRGHAVQISLADATGLLKFGGWVTVSSLISPLMSMLDRFVIGVILGAEAVTHYTVPFQLAERTHVLPGALSSALFPRLAAANPADATQLASTAVRSLAVVMTPLMMAGLMLIDPFLALWLNADFASHAGLTAQILLLGFWINSFARIPHAQLQAAGRPELVAKCHLGELIPYLLLLAGGLHFFGLPGAAVAFGLRTLADWALLMWLTSSLRLGLRLLSVPGLFLGAAFGIAVVFQVGSAFWWVAVSSLGTLSLFWSWTAAPSGVRAPILRIAGKFIK